MIESLTIRDFKSIKEGTLTLGPLTVLIGANASGKTNLLEAIRLLSWMSVPGRDLRNIHRYLREGDLSIRGTPRTWVRDGSEEIGFSTRATLVNREERGELDVCLTVEDGSIVDSVERIELKPLDRAITIRLHSKADVPSRVEFLVGAGRVLSSGYSLIETIPLFSGFEIGKLDIVGQRGGKSPEQIQELSRRHGQRYNALLKGLKKQISDISDFALDTIAMREAEFEEDHTFSFDGANLQPSLYDLCKDPDLKEKVLQYVRGLPEEPIHDLNFELGSDHRVFLTLVESFGGQERKVGAVSLSDGTLHILGVATALLSAEPGSLVIFEEIDNWLHPSRMAMLFDEMMTVINERNLQVLVTTHNAALLDHLPPDTLRDVHCCYRDPEEGDTRVTRLVDIERFPSLMAQGPLGSLITRGVLDRFLKQDGQSNELSPDVAAFLERLKSSSEGSE